MSGEPEQPQQAQNATTPAELGPLPFFAVNKVWYPTIKALSNNEAGVLFKLMVLCAEQRNGGFIPDVDKITRRMWGLLAGLPQRPAENPAIFRQESGGLKVLPYDTKREAQALETSRMQADKARKKAELERKRKEAAAACAGAIQSEREERKEEDISIGGVADSSNEKQCSIGADAQQAAAAPPAPPKPSSMQRPENYGAVLLAFAGLMPDATDDERADAASSFWGINEELGWIDEYGKPFINWMNRAKRYADKCNESLLHTEQMRHQNHAAREKSKEEKAAQYVADAGRLTRPEDAPSAEEVAEELRRYQAFNGHCPESLITYGYDFLAWMDSRHWKNGSERITRWDMCIPGFIKMVLEKQAKEKEQGQ